MARTAVLSVCVARVVKSVIKTRMRRVMEFSKLPCEQVSLQHLGMGESKSKSKTSKKKSEIDLAQCQRLFSTCVVYQDSPLKTL